jgi:hypothetical protein
VRQDAQGELTTADPERFFAPSTSAQGKFASWVGIYLDSPRPNESDRHEIAAIVNDTYRLVAPANLVARLDAGR